MRESLYIVTMQKERMSLLVKEQSGVHCGSHRPCVAIEQLK